jgi:hypothetical protein
MYYTTSKPKTSPFFYIFSNYFPLQNPSKTFLARGLSAPIRRCNFHSFLVLSFGRVCGILYLIGVTFGVAFVSFGEEFCMLYSNTKMFQEIARRPEVLARLEAVNRKALGAVAARVRRENIGRVILSARGLNPDEPRGLNKVTVTR